MNIPPAVGELAMDGDHRELAGLLEGVAGLPAPQLLERLAAVVAHTEAHFAREEQWMSDTAFPLLAEHRAEHRRMLGELQMLQRRARRTNLPMVRAFLAERLPEWLEQHIRGVDSALAAHLIRCRSGPD